MRALTEFGLIVTLGGFLALAPMECRGDHEEQAPDGHAEPLTVRPVAEDAAPEEDFASLSQEDFVLRLTEFIDELSRTVNGGVGSTSLIGETSLIEEPRPTYSILRTIASEPEPESGQE